MLLYAMMGMENLPDASAKSHVFVVPTARLPFGGKETHLGIAAKQRNGISATGVQTLPAAPGLRDETGRWTQGNYTIPEGTLLKIFGQRSGAFGQMRVSASMFIQLREDAAFQSVATRLSGHQKAAFTTAPVQGRFDILTVEQARALGAEVPPVFEGQFNELLVSRVFQLTVMEGERATAPVTTAKTISNSHGEEVVVQTTRKARALDL